MQNEIAKKEMETVKNAIKSCISAVKNDMLSLADGMSDENETEELKKEYARAYREAKTDLMLIESLLQAAKQI